MDELRSRTRRTGTGRIVAATSAAAAVALLLPAVAVASPGKGISQQVAKHEQDITTLQEQVAALSEQVEELTGSDEVLADRVGTLEESSSEQDARTAALAARVGALEESQEAQDGRLDALVAAIDAVREERFPVVAVGGPGPLGGLVGDDDGLSWTETLQGTFEITLDGRENESAGCFVTEVHASSAEEISLRTFEDVDGSRVTYGWRLTLLDTTTEQRGEGEQVLAPVFPTAVEDRFGTAVVEFEDRYTALVEAGDGSAGFLLVVRETPGTAACIERERL